MQVSIAVPKGVTFSDLKLSRDKDGVTFDLDVLEKIETASGLPAGFFMSQPEDAVGEFLVRWYMHHKAAGGEPDPVAEDLMLEASLEGPVSHEPGSA